MPCLKYKCNTLYIVDVNTIGVNRPAFGGTVPHFRDLARNEEFSEIAVINIFFTVLKTKTQLSVGGEGGPAGKISR